jgi:hypothetical protein
MTKKYKYTPTPIPELGITGTEDNYHAAVIAAYKRQHPQHAGDILGMSKRNGRWHIFIKPSRFTRTAHKVAEYSAPKQERTTC